LCGVFIDLRTLVYAHGIKGATPRMKHSGANCWRISAVARIKFAVAENEAHVRPASLFVRCS